MQPFVVKPHKRIGMVLIALFLFAVSYATASPALAARKNDKIKVWRFFQKGQHGRAVLLVCDSGVKLTFNEQNVMWLCTAPEWKVTIYNTKLNIGQKRDFNAYYNRAGGRASGKLRLSQKNQETFMGRDAFRYSYVVESSDPMKEQVEMLYQTGANRAASYSKIEYVCANWIKLHPQVRQFFKCLYRIPGIESIVLQETHIYPGGRKNVVISTGSFAEAQVDKSEFREPTGYKLARFSQIMMEGEKAKEMTGVIEDLFMDPKGK